MSEDRLIMPVVAIRGITMLPGMMIHFDIHKDSSIQAINVALREGKQILVVTQKDSDVEEPEMKDLFPMGTISQVKQMIKMPGNQIRVLATGIRRGYLEELLETKPYLLGAVTMPIEVNADSLTAVEQRAMLRGLKDMLEAYVRTNDKFGKDIVKQLMSADSLDSLINQVAVSVPMTVTSKQKILDATHIVERFEAVMVILANEIEILRIKKDLQSKVKEKVDKNQKDYIMREQLKVIREELGEGNALEDAEEFYKQLRTLQASDEIKEKIKKEIDRFKSVSSSQSESAVARGYVETLLSLPWDKATKDDLDISRAKKILDRDHYGLDKVKERILEFLSVRALNDKGQAPIICLVGPPGTGKTSIARSVATALRKEYVRICLGGVRDEAEIRGHRRTYVGAMPGRLIQGLKSAKVKNPLMLLDEIDKVSSDYKGDTASALLEVLDPEQNKNFVDHYVELPVDLSEVLFICTANSIQTIPKPLLDRMELIEVSSYTENEKLHIAKEHLVPKQLMKNGLTKKDLKIGQDALKDIISFYTKEAGVRSLERKIGELCRKAAMKVLEAKQNGTEADTIKVTKKNLPEFLGKKKYRRNPANERAEVGIVRGLAWTEVGGDTLQIEVNSMPGKGNLLLTGKLGDVMKESAQIALSYVRSIVGEAGVEAEYFEKHDFHLHVPEGAVPKDGPSAGITMATAFYSVVMGTPVNASVAMTGEISLRGRVLPIGGLKEKLLAAKQAGIKTVLVPKENESDLAEISDEILGSLTVITVATMDEVLKHALQKQNERRQSLCPREGGHFAPQNERRLDMNVNNVSLETVCGITSTLPENSLPEFAFAGKSNVGKSSLINAMINRKSLARTSSQPGKTQTINFYNIEDRLYFVDLPGYGYAKVSQTTKEKWGKMIEKYLQKSKQLKLVFLLIDIRHEPSANDRNMYEWIEYNGFEPVIIATKLDKINRSQVQKHVKMLRTGLGLKKETRLIPFSAETKQGKDEIWAVIESYLGDGEEQELETEV